MHLTKNIYLTGFMGTGKTAAGRIVAGRLGVPFLDTDAGLEKKLGKTISQIFSRKGEEFFRNAEAAFIRSTLQLPPQVIALGGGAVLKPGNRDVLRSGIWINLKADPALILKRVSGKKTRPLLGGKVTREKIEEMLKGRLPFYRLAPHQIDTGQFSADAVADDILKIIRKKS